MPVLTGNKKTAKHIKLRKPRKCQFNKHITETTDPTHPIPYKSTISSLLLSTFSPNNNETTPTKKMGTYSSSGRFRALGCKAASVAETVSVPAMIRSSADWDVKKSKKKKKNGYENKRGVEGMWIDCSGCGNSAACAAVVVPDVWCGPGIGFSAADDAAPMDCLVARRNVNGRVKIDAEKTSHRERAACPVRRTVSPDAFSFIDSDTALLTTHPEPELFGTTRYCRHARPPSPDAFSEIMILQDSFVRGERINMPDRHRAWRLDVDNMTYEELLELGEQIGHVNTGLEEDEISSLLRKFKLLRLYDLSSQLPMQVDRKCSICQEEYEVDDDIGKLNCGHGYHIQCIKQWLLQKNACPVCKTAPVAR